MPNIVEGFSLSHAAVLDRTGGATHGGVATPADAGKDHPDGDIYGIRSGSLSVETDSYENTGDDAVLSTWSWFNYGQISITSGYLSFENLALITGSPVGSSGTPGAVGSFVTMDLWREESLNQSPKPMLLRVPSQATDFTVRVLEIVLYSVKFDPISFEGPNYKDGLVVTYGGRALMSNIDEKNTAIAKRAIGRLISRVTVAAG